MIDEITNERKRYHVVLDYFAAGLQPRALLYDIGKSDVHDYKSRLERFNYTTIDIDLQRFPDIVLNIEEARAGSVAPADALLMNGVIEYCTDPLKMIAFCNGALKIGGRALFGMILTGYTVSSENSFRFTVDAALNAIIQSGFEIRRVEVVEREGIPSYVYAVCRKAREI